MAWEVEYTDEIERWWVQLDDAEQDSVDSVVGVLEIQGPKLKEPYGKPIASSTHHPDM